MPVELTNSTVWVLFAPVLGIESPVVCLVKSQSYNGLTNIPGCASIPWRIFSVLAPVAIRTIANAPPTTAVCILFWSAAPKGKAILDEGNAEPRTGAEARCVGCVEIGEEEADKLEGNRY